LFGGDLGYSDVDREANIKRIILGAYCLYNGVKTLALRRKL